MITDVRHILPILAGMLLIVMDKKDGLCMDRYEFQLHHIDNNALLVRYFIYIYICLVLKLTIQIPIPNCNGNRTDTIFRSVHGRGYCAHFG